MDKWTHLLEEGAIAIALTPGLTGQDFRVLLLLLGHTEYGNEVRIGQTKVREVLGLSQQAVSHSFRKLEKAGILLKMGKRGQVPWYEINEDVAWKGSVRQLRLRCQARAEKELNDGIEPLQQQQRMQTVSA